MVKLRQNRLPSLLPRVAYTTAGMGRTESIHQGLSLVGWGANLLQSLCLQLSQALLLL